MRDTKRIKPTKEPKQNNDGVLYVSPDTLDNLNNMEPYQNRLGIAVHGGKSSRLREPINDFLSQNESREYRWLRYEYTAKWLFNQYPVYANQFLGHENVYWGDDNESGRLITINGKDEVFFQDAIDCMEKESPYFIGEINNEKVFYVGHEDIASDLFPPVTSMWYIDTEVAVEGFVCGARLYKFSHFVVLAVGLYAIDELYRNRFFVLSRMPHSFLSCWVRFETECMRRHMAMQPLKERVVIIGGRASSFKPIVKWDDIILPAKLKDDILFDISTFFSTGTQVYKQLNIPPFRKLLFAGLPGTGKTMLCSALGKWVIERGYLAIYISSADQHGATFHKIHEALTIAENTQVPTLIIVEELDAYLTRPDERAQLLNVLDGSESPQNEHGTLLIATTNYPQLIDDRIMKRPGRIDRIFVIPPLKNKALAEDILRHYFNVFWSDNLLGLAPRLLNKPGAFVRELAIHVLTRALADGRAEVTADEIEKVINGLEEQIRLQEDFLEESARDKDMGFSSNEYGSEESNPLVFTQD